MTNKTMIAKAVKAALFGGLAASLSITAPTAFAAEESDEEENKVVVTGSRLTRTDIEGALPVTVYDREDLDASGDVSVADFLRNTSFNSFGSFRPASGSSAQSQASLSLRGLGGGRSLILIDGRRAPASPQTGSAQDLNSIPLGAVERIEILSDGASAIYGTDAIGGVVNVITRKDFDGAEFRIGLSDPKRPGGSTDEGSLLFGASGDRASAYIGVSWSGREIVFQRDRPWSAGGTSSFGNNYLIGGLQGVQNFAPGGAGCTGTGLFTIPGTTGCFYDYTALAADEAELKNQAIFGRAQYQINDDWSTYLNLTNSRVTSFGRYAPTPIQLTVSATSPNNYTGLGTDVLLRHRSIGTGTRDTNTDQNQYDALWGFEGTINDTVELDFGIRHNEYKYDEFGRNYVVRPLLEAAINSGAYDILDPEANPDSVLNSVKATINRESVSIIDEVYINSQFDIFEMDGGSARFLIGGEYRQEDYEDQYDSLSEGGVIAGSAGNSAGGGRDVTALYFETLLPVMDGLEVNVAGRYDDYSDFGNNFAPKVSVKWVPSDDLTLRASWGEGFRAPSLAILTAQPAFSADGTVDPDTCAFLTGSLSCQTQLDAYALANPNLQPEESDQFGLGVVWEATDSLSVSLDYYDIELTNQVSGIGSGEIIACVRGQRGETRGASAAPCPAGVAEIANTATPGDASNGLGVAFRDPIPFDVDGNGTIDAGETIAPVLFAQRGFVNRGKIETSGFDFNLRNEADLGSYGSLSTNFQLGYVRDFKLDGTDVIDQPGVPDMRANLSNRWGISDFQVVWNINYIGDTLSTNGTFLAGCEAAGGPCVPGVDYLDTIPLRNSSWVTHDLQVNYFTPWDGTISLGATNLTDKDPVLDQFDGGGRGYDTGLYDGYGRIVYLRYTQTF